MIENIKHVKQTLKIKSKINFIAILVLLCDFELSKFLDGSKHTHGQGTYHYMAPEVNDSEYYDRKSGKSNYNLKSDIYSLGVIATKLFNFEDSIKNIRKLKNM